MKRIKQMALSLIMAASLLGSIPLTANAATVSTSEFGTMNYSLDSDSELSSIISSDDELIKKSEGTIMMGFQPADKYEYT